VNYDDDFGVEAEERLNSLLTFNEKGKLVVKPKRKILNSLNSLCSPNEPIELIKTAYWGASKTRLVCNNY